MRFAVVLLCLVAAAPVHAARKTLEEASAEAAAVTGVVPRLVVPSQMSVLAGLSAKPCLLVIDDEAVRCLHSRNYEPRFIAKYSEISDVAVDGGLTTRIMVLAPDGPSYFIVPKTYMARVLDAIRERLER